VGYTERQVYTEIGTQRKMYPEQEVATQRHTRKTTYKRDEHEIRTNKGDERERHTRETTYKRDM